MIPNNALSGKQYLIHLVNHNDCHAFFVQIRKEWSKWHREKGPLMKDGKHLLPKFLSADFLESKLNPFSIAADLKSKHTPSELSSSTSQSSSDLQGSKRPSEDTKSRRMSQIFSKKKKHEEDAPKTEESTKMEVQKTSSAVSMLNDPDHVPTKPSKEEKSKEEKSKEEKSKEEKSKEEKSKEEKSKEEKSKEEKAAKEEKSSKRLSGLFGLKRKSKDDKTDKN